MAATVHGFDREPFFTGVSFIDGVGIALGALRAVFRGQRPFPRELTFLVVDSEIQVHVSKAYRKGKPSLLGRHSLPVTITQLDDPYLKQPHVLVSVAIGDQTYVISREGVQELQRG